MDGTHGALSSSRLDLGIPNHDRFGFLRTLHLLQRRRLLVWGVFLFALACGFVFASLRTPTFNATALVMITPNESRAPAPGETTATRPEESYVDSQVQILRSPALAQQLVDRLRLADDPEWAPETLRAQRRRLEAANNVADAINVRRRGSTYVIEVSVRAQDPDKAARMANDLVALYFDARAQARVEHAAQSSEWLRTRLDELRHEVQQREAEAQAYRGENGLAAVNELPNEQQMRDAEASLVSARTDLAERQARYQRARGMINRGASDDAVAAALNTPLLTTLRTRLAEATRRVTEYAAQYGALHTVTQTARGERDDLARQLHVELARQMQTLRAEAELAEGRVEAMQGQQAAVRAQVVGANAASVRLRELERDANEARAVYENFLSRYNEQADARGVDGDAQVVAAAAPPTAPANTSILFIMLIAAGIGALAAAIAVFVAEQLTTTLQTSEDVEKFGASLLTSIPELKRGHLRGLPSTERHPAGFVTAKPMSAFAESIRMLRAKIAHPGYSRKVRVVAITSALAGDGKSSTALALARVAALSGRKAMLIDCDLRRRTLNSMLDIEPRAGVLQVLRGDVSWRAAAGRDDASGAHVLPATDGSFTSEDVFNSDAMKRLVNDLANVYDFIILDCAPVLTLAEVRDLAALADGVVVVARRNKTPKLALQTAMTELRAINATVLGVAFNGVDVSAPGRLSYADPLYFAAAKKGMYTA